MKGCWVDVVLMLVSVVNEMWVRVSCVYGGEDMVVLKRAWVGEGGGGVGVWGGGGGGGGFFFFQAEDGIRDIGVTGVQTCALPI